MRRAAAPALAIACALVGLAASAAALADSVGPAPTWCAADSCATVRTSAWAHPLGVPLPVVGVTFFAGMLILVVGAAGGRVARTRRILAVAGAAGAVCLIAVQALVIGAWCRLCLVADVSAIALAATVVLRPPWRAPGRAPSIAALVLGIVAVAGPLTTLRGAAPPPAPAAGAALPEVIAREQTPGVVDVVDFVDFECPFCRMLHGHLVTAVERAAVPVRIVRKMVPLDRHRGALPAALAWCCAEQQGKGDAMAEALLAAPVAELTPAGCERIAAAVGLDLTRYRADVASPAIRARVERDRADAGAAGVTTLPTVYIGDRVFVGAGASIEELVAALTHGAT